MVIKIGHRGAMGYEPENTLASFRKALDLDVDMVELDVYLCNSGELVVIHDDKVDRTTNGNGSVVNKSYKELRVLDAGNGEKIPLLSDVLDLIDKKVRVNIELKGVNTAEPVYNLIEIYVVEKGWSYDHFLVSSFNHVELKKFKTLCNEVDVSALIVAASSDYFKLAEELNVYSLNPCSQFVDKNFINDAHDKGMKVCVWTVDDPIDIQKMKSIGVDGIFSNYPDRL